MEFSIIWGLAIAFVLRIIQPSFEGFVTIIPKFNGIFILIIAYLTFISDVVITVLTVLKLNKELEKMEELQKSISKLSDDMSELIGNSTLKAVDKFEEEHREVEEKKNYGKLFKIKNSNMKTNVPSLKADLIIFEKRLCTEDSLVPEDCL